MNYSKMTADEIRLEIAKRKGWKFFQCDSPHYPAIAAYKPDEEPDYYGFTFHTVDPTGKEIIFSDYEALWTTDLSAALELIEEANLIVRPSLIVTHLPRRWISGIIASVSFAGTVRLAPGSEFEAATAPLAICMAWLNWEDKLHES